MTRNFQQQSNDAYIAELTEKLDAMTKRAEKAERSLHRMRCDEHQLDASNGWGCPVCVQLLRTRVKELEELLRTVRGWGLATHHDPADDLKGEVLYSRIDAALSSSQVQPPSDPKDARRWGGPTVEEAAILLRSQWLLSDYRVRVSADHLFVLAALYAAVDAIALTPSKASAPTTTTPPSSAEQGGTE